MSILRTILKKRTRKNANSKPLKPQWFQGFGIMLMTLAFIAGAAVALSQYSSFQERQSVQAEQATPPCLVGCGTATPITSTTPVTATQPCTVGCGTATPPISLPTKTPTATQPCTVGCGTATPIPTQLQPTSTPTSTPTPTPVVTPIATPTPTPVVTPIVTPTPTPVVTPIVTPTPTPTSVDVAITKSCLVDGRACNASPVENNKRVEYTLTVTATGNTTALNVRVVDDYDQNFLRNIGNISDYGAADGNVINWTLGDMAAGSTRVLKYQATVNTAEEKTIPNVATVSANNDSNTNNNRAEYSFTTPKPVVIPTSPVVKIEHWCYIGTNLPVYDGSSFGNYFKKDCGDAKLSDFVWYAIRVTNTGTATANNVTVALPLVNPNLIEGQTLVNPDTGATTPYSFTVSQMAANNSTQRIYRSQVKTTGVDLLANIDVASTATVRYANPGLGDNTSDTAVFHIKQTLPEKSILVKKSCVVAGTTTPCNDAKSGLKAGSVITYVLTVINNGKSDIKVDTLVDTYDPKLLEVAAISPVGGVWNATNFTVTWSNLGTYKSLESKEYRFNAKLSDKAIAGSTVKNTVTVTAESLKSTANYDFTIPSQTVVTPPPTVRTGATDVALLIVFAISLGAGVYFYTNSGKLAQGFGGSRGKF